MPSYPELKLYVGGEWRSRDGAPVINPADESILGTVPHATRADLDDEVARIRKDGFAITGEGDEFSGIAAPVLDHDGHLVAALTMSRPFDENTRERRIALGRAVREAAASISKQLGHTREAASRSVSVKGSSRGLGKTNAANRV